ncbi:hypothetical protein ACGFS9_10415 [Streptomyces sp. NPDC048566]|uniref:hypothetical protein n=1 Tax=Streptomyces sp. NPDC048566 TaxID=3365569 RepID=UPI0037232833
MAHAAPVSGTPRTSEPIEVFGPRAHAVGRWAVPVATGLVYGFWAANTNRDAGPITGWNVLFGFVSAIVFAAAFFAVLTLTRKTHPALHALAWAAFAGCALGFLVSQSGASVLLCVFMSLGVFAGVFVGTFYHYYTHEDAQGRPR